MMRRRRGDILDTVAVVFVKQGIRFIFGVPKDINALRVVFAVVVRGAFRQDGRPHLRRSDNFKRRTFGNGGGIGAFPARNRNGKTVGKSEKKAGFIIKAIMLVNAEELFLSLVTFDIMKMFQRGLGSPAKKKR